MSEPLPKPSSPSFDALKAKSQSTQPPPSVVEALISPAEQVITTTSPSATPSGPTNSVAPQPVIKPSLLARFQHLLHVPWFYAVIVLVLVSSGLASWAVYQANHKVKPVVVVVPRKVIVVPKPEPPKTVADPLTGLQVDPAAAQQPVAGVMIENLDPDARPQSGLSQAGIVYEALAEGGITRFLALFQEPFPATIGPVRSLRPYYLDWGLEYNAPVAHAGGSEPALAQVGPSGLKNIDALVYDGSYFYRATDRYAPHNLYTNNDLLTNIVAKLGFATAPSFTPIARKADSAEATPTHPKINISFSTSSYAVEYDYVAATNSYARFLAAKPHIDRNTGQQILVKNVVVEYVPASYSTQQDGKPETDLGIIGQGKALIFTDGGVTAATWSKASIAAPTQLLDAAGQPIKLNAGNTWVSVIPTINLVTY